MRKVYICSPYRAKDGAELDRNIDYAQQLTRQALEAGLAPITPHLYMTQCMDDKKPEERARGMAAGLALLKGCDFVIAGVKYGITEGMDREIHTANMLGIAVIDANQIKRHLEYEEKRQERAASDSRFLRGLGQRALHAWFPAAVMILSSGANWANSFSQLYTRDAGHTTHRHRLE